MTTLLIQTESTPMTINLPTIAPMTHEQFYEFYLANRDLRIERTASREVVIMPPAFSDTGNRNFNIAVQLGSWANQDGTGLGSIPVQALPYRTARLALPMLRGSGWSAGMR